MKMIVAVIKPEQMPAVKQALFDADSSVEARAQVDPLTGKFSPAAAGDPGLVAGFYAANADLKIIAGSPIPDASSPSGWDWDCVDGSGDGQLWNTDVWVYDNDG